MVTVGRQKGISSLGWLITLFAGGLALTCMFRLGPAYLDNRYVVAALESLAEKPDVHELSKIEILSQLRSFATVNSIRGEELDSFKVSKKGHRTIVSSVYEKRVHLFHNIDVVMSFKNQLDSSNLEACCSYLVEDESKK